MDKKELKNLLKELNSNGCSCSLDDVETSLRLGLTEEQIKFCFNSKFDWTQQFKLQHAFTRKKLTEEQIKFAAKPEYSSGEMEAIFTDFEFGVTIEQEKIIQQYRQNGFDDDQVYVIRRGLQDGQITVKSGISATPSCFKYRPALSLEQIQLYAKKEFDAEQMRYILWGIEEGFTEEQLNFIARPELSSSHMLDVITAIELGFSIEQMESCIRPELNDMDRNMRIGGIRGEIRGYIREEL